MSCFRGAALFHERDEHLSGGKPLVWLRAILVPDACVAIVCGGIGCYMVHSKSDKGHHHLQVFVNTIRPGFWVNILYEQNLLMSNVLKRFSCLCSKLKTNTIAAEISPCACAHEWSQLVLQGTCSSGYNVLYRFQHCMGSKPAFQQVVWGLLKLVEREVAGCNWGNVRVRTRRRGLEGMKTMASMRYWKSVVEETDLK